ncbi:MAG: hypothetical protein IPJ78_17330 [Gemmatimonadetes bacterium]|nr:hypothetical protein [Gemmatimonadota bacterium]
MLFRTFRYRTAAHLHLMKAAAAQLDVSLTRAMRLALLLLTTVLVSCARSEAPRAESARIDAAVASISAMDDSSCAFDRALRHIVGDSLVREFVRRAATGSFDRTEEWLPTAVDCIGHEPGYDTFLVLDSTRVSQLPAGSDTLRYALSSRLRGRLVGGQFEPDSVARVDTIVAYRTMAGWRIASPAFWNWMSPEAARLKGWRVR